MTTYRGDFREKMRGIESIGNIAMLKSVHDLWREGIIKDKPMSELPIILQQTVPDERFDVTRVAFYLDGEAVHKKRSREDRAIDDQLVHQHWFVIRLRYKNSEAIQHDWKLRPRGRLILTVIQQIVNWRKTFSVEELRGGRVAQYGDDYEFENLDPELEDDLTMLLYSSEA